MGHQTPGSSVTLARTQAQGVELVTLITIKGQDIKPQNRCDWAMLSCDTLSCSFPDTGAENSCIRLSILVK